MPKLKILLACAFGVMLGGSAIAAVDDNPAVKATWRRCRPCIRT